MEIKTFCCMQCTLKVHLISAILRNDRFEPVNELLSRHLIVAALI